MDELKAMVARLEALRDTCIVYSDAFNKDYPVDHEAMLTELEQELDQITEQSERMIRGYS